MDEKTQLNDNNYLDNNKVENENSTTVITNDFPGSDIGDSDFNKFEVFKFILFQEMRMNILSLLGDKLFNHVIKIVEDTVKKILSRSLIIRLPMIMRKYLTLL